MRTIALTQGKVAIVDDGDFAMLIGAVSRWCAHCNGGRTYYAVAQQNTIKMHRVVLGAKKGQRVDHVNGNGLDNRKENLRFCTAAQNQYNRQTRVNSASGYKGVMIHNATGLWRARIVFQRLERNLGYFRDPKDAAIRYNEEAVKLFGSFARLNDV